jgi:hypothetical protein
MKQWQRTKAAILLKSTTHLQFAISFTTKINQRDTTNISKLKNWTNWKVAASQWHNVAAEDPIQFEQMQKEKKLIYSCTILCRVSMVCMAIFQNLAICLSSLSLNKVTITMLCPYHMTVTWHSEKRGKQGNKNLI